MIFLLERLWPAAAAALVLGLLVQLVLGPGRASPSAGLGGLAGALALALLAAALAASGLVPGRPGLWLDVAATLACSYAVGVVCGALLRRGRAVRARRPPPVGPAPSPPAAAA